MAENITPTEINRRLQAVYGAETVDRWAVNRWAANRWAIKSRNSEPGQLNISDEQRRARPIPNRWAIKSRNSEPGQLNISDEQRRARPIPASDDEHCSRVDNLIQSDRRITQQGIANALGISKERVGFIIQK
ncbi:hypothetical protein QE152_g11107 [Popillia japonica]|uniref:Uncharacterized protein n=1 Tax=Popillia japonica TaxID=7064 RepID=A0AAW1LMA3_POPJA